MAGSGAGGPTGKGQWEATAREAHLVYMDVVEVVFVVDGLEHALQLPGGTTVHHQDESDPDRVGQHILHGVLVPLDVLVGFA